MKKKFILLVACLLLFPFLSQAETKGIKIVPIKDSSGRQVGTYKGSYALIIGVAEYNVGWPKLPSVIDETAHIRNTLEARGFHVKRVLNPDDDQLEQAFEDFIEKYGYDQNNRLLFFFSGHGYSRKKGAKGYLVPTNAPDPRKDEKGFLRRALPMSQVLAWCRQMEAKHALFLFDSCFSGTIFKTKALPQIPPHISAITSRPVRQFIAAGDAEEVVPAESVFAKCFVRGLSGEADLSKDGYITGSELGMYLRDKVLYYHTGQTPQYGKIRDPELDEGDFVFAVYTLPKLSPKDQNLEMSSESDIAYVPSLSTSGSLVETRWLAEGSIRGSKYGYYLREGGILGFMSWKPGYKFEPDVWSFWRADPIKNTRNNRWEQKGKSVYISVNKGAFQMWGTIEADKIHCDVLPATGKRYKTILHRQ